MGRHKTIDWEHNPEAVKQYNQRYNHDHHAQIFVQKRNYTLLKKYGITLAQYNQMLVNQDGVCAICGRPPKHYALSVDHNHVTGENRKLLCAPCNKVLAYLENEEWLTRAQQYLEEENHVTDACNSIAYSAC
jgi:Recombination endonuclease VII